jgi:hypothetical protein
MRDRGPDRQGCRSGTQTLQAVGINYSINISPLDMDRPNYLVLDGLFFSTTTAFVRPCEKLCFTVEVSTFFKLNVFGARLDF